MSHRVPAPATTKPRILHVGPFPAHPDGGIAAYVIGLMRSPLAARVRLAVLDTTVPMLLRRRRALRPALSIMFFMQLLFHLLRRRPDVVHIHTSDGAGFWEKGVLAEVVHAAGIPVVLHLHGGDFERWLGTLSPVRTRFARRILGRAARVLILAAGWRPLLERFAPPEHIAVLPNAIDCAQFAPPARTHAIERPRVLFLGLLSERKGLDELCAALQRLRDDGRLDFDVDIVGGEEVLGSRRRYEEHFAAAGLASWVRFHGPAFGADKLRFLHAAEVFVLPSRAESFGIANLEAMAAGLAVISSRTGAIPEYLEDGVHGLLIAPGDAAALAVAIDRLMNDPALRRRLGAAARLRARDYDWNVMTGRLGELYAGILQPLSVATDHRPKP